MPSQNPLKGDEADVKHAAIRTAQYIGELEAHLRLLDGTKNNLATTIATKATGAEVQRQMADAHAEGMKLRQFLENIERQLTARAGKITEDDLRGLSSVAKSYVHDGMNVGDGQSFAGATAEGAVPTPSVNVNF
ncbi:hypothetical protein AB0L57_30030 [Nocardia sp. NPDC052254]|uniref:hypothetical protein n=1 Tax=Nocardia sp. NPDC052254 TaxID=3155681 RepID=UPI0034434020